MRQYVSFLVVALLLGFLFSGFGCGRKKDMEAQKGMICITELGGNQFQFAIKKSAFHNVSGEPFLGGSFTNGELNIPLSEVKDENDKTVMWLESPVIYMAGHRRIQFAYVNGDDIFLPVVPEDREINCGYSFEYDCWEINFSQASYEILAHGKYRMPTPIKLAGADSENISVKINIVYFYDPVLTFPIYVSGFKLGDWKSEWDWKDPYYPDEEGFIEISLSSDRIDNGFNLSWFDSSGKEIWMNLNQLKRDGVPCIENGTLEYPAHWKLNEDWKDMLPATLTDPNSYIVPHVCVDDPNNCCCIDDVETDVTDDACVCPNCPSCPTCPECSDANQPIIDPETGLQFYGDEVWGDPEPNSHFRFRREDDEEWTLFFLKSDVPVDEQIGDMALRGTFNNWKSTVPLVDSEIFDGWIQTENPIDIDPGKQRLNFIFGEFYANHSNFISSLFHLEHEGDYSFGIVVPEEDDKLRPWD